jgi:spermidine synthase
MNGLHLIGDLTGCRCDPQLLLDGERFRAKCLEMVATSGLTTMDSTFHSFDGGGFTGTVVLAESHLAIHTWPGSLTSSPARWRSTRSTAAATR